MTAQASGKVVNAGGLTPEQEKELICKAFNDQAEEHCKKIKGNYDRFKKAQQEGKLGNSSNPWKQYYEARKQGLIEGRGQFLEGMMKDLPKGGGWEYDQVAAFVSLDGSVLSLAEMATSPDKAIRKLAAATAKAMQTVSTLGKSPSKARGALLGNLSKDIPKSGRKWAQRPLFPDIKTPNGTIAEVKGPYDSPGKNHEHYQKLGDSYMDIDAKACKCEVMEEDGTCKGGPTKDEAANTIMPWLMKK